MTEESKKAWTLLALKKGLAVAPVILKLLMFVACIALISIAAQTYVTAGQEIDALIEAGDLPACIKNYVLGIFGVLAAAILLLVCVRRK